MSGSDDETYKGVRSWIDSETVDSVADYAARGRKYAALTEAQLSSAWVEIFKASARDIHNKEHRTIQSDYTAEFSLRGMTPPFTLVHDDLQLMTDNIKAWMATLTQDELDTLGEKVEDDFTEFQGKRDNERH